MKRKFEITDAAGGGAFTVRVVTRASKAGIAGIQDDGVIKVRLSAAPGEGAENQELIDLLARVLGVETNRIEIVAGEKSRDKIISVDGVSPETLESMMLAAVEEGDD